MAKNTRPFCPLIKKPCKGAECMFAVTLRGKDPQSGQDIDEEGCAVAYLPKLLIEGSKAGVETGAAVESLRNVIVLNHNQLIGGLMSVGDQKSIGNDNG